MNSITKISLMIGVALALLFGCVPMNPHQKAIEATIQSAKTKADYEALAVHYEQAADEARQQAEEHKKVLNEFLKGRYFPPGKQAAVGFKTHCEYLIDLYSKEADENLAMAKIFHKIAEGMQ